MGERSWRVHRGVVVVSLVVAGLAGCTGGGRPAAQPAAVAAPTTSASVAAPTRTPEVIDFPIRSWRRLPPSPPMRVEIPAIGVSSSLVRLGLNADGTMQVPGEFQLAGWFTGGPQPGQLGPAVIAGHVDSRTGPAVFYRLRELRPGDQIRVVRADRRVVSFQVESLASYPKWALSGDEVYGATTAPSLRLITCAGSFDRARRSYRDNLVVSARIVGEPADSGRTEADR
ncbi:MAG TPA: class F sortase [Actinomycetes bacterium]|nr:class F sortase [Actinomycetes bacterium]